MAFGKETRGRLSKLSPLLQDHGKAFALASNWEGQRLLARNGVVRLY